MTATENQGNGVVTVEEMQQGWHDLTLRVEQLEAENAGLEQENKSLRHLLERVIEHRQKSHGELVLLLTALVTKLPINDVGTIVAKLVEHNDHVNEALAALAKGKVEATHFQPIVLKALEQTKRELLAALKPAVEELIRLDTPLDNELLRSLLTQPELFFSSPFLRANRCFLKGQVPRERIVKDFGEDALVFFKDLTTDPKLNRHPKLEEIVLAPRSDFKAMFQQNPAFLPDKREALMTLYEKIQRSKAPTDEARAQKRAFTKVSFILELLHYYENQNTEAPDVVFAQRLPALVEQLVITSPRDDFQEEQLKEAEGLLALVINPDHRQAIVNNVGKVSAAARMLRFVLTLRAEKVSDLDQVVAEFIKHLLPARLTKAPSPKRLAHVLRLFKPEIQHLILRAIMDSDRLPGNEAEALGKAVGKELGLSDLEAPKKTPEDVPAEVERQLAWEKIKLLLLERADPAAIAAAVRSRLHSKYDAAELKQSWITLIEADAVTLIRTFCQLPYLPDGSTDPIARTVMESYLSRLTHEKYASTYHKILTSLRNMFHANPHSPTLLNFITLVKWVDAGTAGKLCADIGMQVAA